MSKLPIEYLWHIQSECAYILEATSELTKHTDLEEDETLKRAVVRSLEIIGEATKKLPADLTKTWNQIPWRNMAGMRDKLIHDYMDVSYRLVFDVIKNKIPDLKTSVETIIAELSGEETK